MTYTKCIYKGFINPLMSQEQRNSEQRNLFHAPNHISLIFRNFELYCYLQLTNLIFGFEVNQVTKIPWQKEPRLTFLNKISFNTANKKCLPKCQVVLPTINSSHHRNSNPKPSQHLTNIGIKNIMNQIKFQAWQRYGSILHIKIWSNNAHIY